jgi:SAM-dependent methyltransferase
MVDYARWRYPFADVQLGDARDLSRIGDNSVALVAFSYAGIDAVDREGRRRILAEASRVLRPNGIFWFSTLHLNGPAPRERPWRPLWPRRDSNSSLRFAVNCLRTCLEIPGNTRNYIRNRALQSRGQGWLVAPNAAHNYRLLVHYTSLASQIAALVTAGFGPDPVIFENERGTRIAPHDDARNVVCFNVLARKAGGG